jgi:hypothetical protein
VNLAIYKIDNVLKKYGPAHYHEQLWFKDITDFVAGTAVGDNKCPENTARVKISLYYSATKGTSRNSG